PQLRQSGRWTAWPLACAATISGWRPASNSFPSARVNPQLAISPRSSGRLIFKTSAHCLSPSAPVFTNLTIQATRLPPIRDQTPNYRFGARTPNLQAVPTNWRDCDTALRNRGSLTIWFTDEALAGWKAQPRTTPGGQPHYSDLAIETALTLRAVFRLALRQSEGLMGSIMRMLEIDLPVPDHMTLSR